MLRAQALPDVVLLRMSEGRGSWAAAEQKQGACGLVAVPLPVLQASLIHPWSLWTGALGTPLSSSCILVLIILFRSQTSELQGTKKLSRVKADPERCQAPQAAWAVGICWAQLGLSLPAKQQELVYLLMPCASLFSRAWSVVPVNPQQLGLWGMLCKGLEMRVWNFGAWFAIGQGAGWWVAAGAGLWFWAPNKAQVRSLRKHQPQVAEEPGVKAVTRSSCFCHVN